MKKTMTFYGIMTASFTTAAIFFSGPVFAAQECQIGDSDTSIDDLVHLIQNPKCNIRSIDDLISTFPSSVLSQFTLFYESESVQGPHFGDYLHPRAILATANANKQLMMSFNGSKTEPNYLGFEVLQIDRNNGKLSKDVFKYYDIQFPNEDATKKQSWDQINKQITVSNANPAKCVVCHGNPAKPIYQGYPTWLGSYGSFHIDGTPGEPEKFQEFQANSAATPNSRYRHLIYTDDGYTGSPTGSLLKGYKNAKFNFTLAEANGIRVGTLAQATPDYQNFRYAIAGAILDCPDYNSFFPASIFRSLESNVDSTFDLSTRYTDKKVESTLQPFFADGGNQFGEIFSMAGANTLPDFIQHLKQYYGSNIFFDLAVDTFKKQGRQRTDGNAVKLRFVMEGRGIDISNWFLDLMQPTYRTMESGDADTMVWPMLQNDPGFSDFSDTVSKIRAGVDGNEQERLTAQLCSGLKAKSVSQLQKVGAVTAVPKPPPFVGSDYPVIFTKTCAKCHLDFPDQIAPAIPFGSKSAFETWLRGSGMKDELISRLTTVLENERMPPTRVLSPAEIKDIIKYLNAVAP